HKARVEPAFLDQEGRQAREVLVDQEGDATFRERADFRKGQRQVVGGESNWFGVEVAAGEDVVVRGKHKRIVGDGVGLVNYDLRRLTNLRQAGAHHLGLAAQRIGVLHFLA